MKTPSFRELIRAYLTSAYSWLHITTHEELRVVDDIRGAIKEWKPVVNVHEWDFETGLIRTVWENGEVSGINQFKDTATIPKALLNVLGCIRGLATQKKENPDSTASIPDIFILKDIQAHLREPLSIRAIRNMQGILRETQTFMITVGSSPEFPSDLTREVQHVDFNLPTKQELKTLFENFYQGSIAPDGSLDDDQVDAIAESAMGMTTLAADNAFALAAVTMKQQEGDYVWDLRYTRTVFEQKISNLKDTALEYVRTDGGFELLGGLDVLKDWVFQRKLGYTKRARELNLPLPKGVLLAGVKGTGKTQTAKAIAHEFGFPLFKLDIGKLFNSKVGGSEALTRELIKTLDGIGAAVVLVDEMEKSLGSHATGGSGDSGTSSRMFGALLSWMAEKTCPVFIVGTLNDHEKMPPELIRRGRFDDIFFVDIPTDLERRAIFKTLLTQRYKISGPGVVTQDLINVTRDFTGAEIDGLIQDSLYRCLVMESSSGTANNNVEDVLGSVMVTTASNMTPQAQINPTLLEATRASASSFRSASDGESKKPAIARSRGRKLAD